MKLAKSALFSSVILLAACGIADRSTISSQDSQQKSSSRVLVPIEAEIESVEAQSAQSPATGLWTEITVRFQVPCYQKLEQASLSYSYRDGKVEILTAIYASSAKQLDFVCQAFSLETKQVSVPGVFSKEDISIVNLATELQEIPDETMVVQTIQHIKLIDAKPLCEAGTACVINGTEVELELPGISCVDTLGPISYKALENKDKSVTLYVNAVNFASKRALTAFCPSVVETHKITLPNVFVSKDNLEVITLQ